MKRLQIPILKILLFFTFITLWSTLYAVTETYKDEFNAEVYSENDGTEKFSDDWYESEEDGPTSGYIRVNDASSFGSYALRLRNLDDLDKYIYRVLDLTDAAAFADSVVLTLDYDASNADDHEVTIGFYNRNDKYWYEVDTISGSGTGQINYTVAPEYLSYTSAVLFIGTDRWRRWDETYVDNVLFTVTYHYVDTDGDGVIDIFDLDDDNDGIFDSDEKASSAVAQSGNWQDEGNFRASSAIGNTETKLIALAGDGTTEWSYTPDGTFNSDSSLNLWASDVYGDTSLEILFDDVTEGDTRKMTLYFSQPQKHVTIHFDRLGGSDGSTANSIHFTLSDSNISLTRLAGNTQFIANRTTKEIYRDTTNNLTDPESGNNADQAAAGSVSFESSVPFDRLPFDIGWIGSDGGDGFELIIEANSYTSADTDGDGVNDEVDIDSDNDGIPDNVEAQGTDNYTPPSGSDSDGDGLDDAYDPDNGGSVVSLPDSDGDNTPDFLDNDSDNDGYSDCEEGVTQSIDCPIEPSVTPVGTNGLEDALEGGSDQGYTNTNNSITDPNPDTATQMQDEVKSNNEAAYREFLCGKGLISLTAYHWRMISLPCDTGTNTVQDVFSGLGTYGNDDNFVMYKQTGTSDSYEVNDTHKNTDKTMLKADDTLEQGISYWIITDADHTVTIDKTLNGLSPTDTNDTNESSIDITDPDFTKVHLHTLPDNMMRHGGEVKKYMAGNPFPYAFMVKNLYFSHGSTGGSYHAMGESANDPYINATFYKHDSNETGPAGSGV